jgi:hypothetical protein
MFEEAFHLTIKDIHLTLEVKTSFDNYNRLQYEIQFSETWSFH